MNRPGKRMTITFGYRNITLTHYSRKRSNFCGVRETETGKQKEKNTACYTEP